MAQIAVEPQDALALSLDNPAVLASPDVVRLRDIARAITALPDPDIDPSFAMRLEARLLAEALHEGIGEAPGRRLRLAPDASSPAPVVTPIPANVVALPRRRFVVRRSVVAAIAAAMLVAVPIFAAGSALPGTSLYRVKLGLERLDLVLTRGPIADGFLLLDHAQRRLDEVDQLVALGRTRLIARTLDAMDTALRAGTTLILRHARDAKTLQRLADTLRVTTGRISTMLASAPAGVRPDLFDSLVSGNALTREVDAALALGVAGGRASPPAPPAAAVPQGAALPEVAPPDVATPYVKVDYPAKPPAPNGGRGNDDTTSRETDSPCLAKMYVGPGSGTVQSVCATVTNEQGGGPQQAPPTDGPITRSSGPIDPPAPHARANANGDDGRTSKKNTYGRQKTGR